MKAVFDDDLKTFLDNLGALKDIEAGRIKCLACGTNITLNNLVAAFPQNGTIRFICDNPQCIKMTNHVLEATAT